VAVIAATVVAPIASAAVRSRATLLAWARGGCRCRVHSRQPPDRNAPAGWRSDCNGDFEGACLLEAAHHAAPRRTPPDRHRKMQATSPKYCLHCGPPVGRPRRGTCAGATICYAGTSSSFRMTLSSSGRAFPPARLVALVARTLLRHASLARLDTLVLLAPLPSSG